MCSFSTVIGERTSPEKLLVEEKLSSKSAEACVKKQKSTG